MDHPIFYILATVLAVLVLYMMVSLAYMQRRKKAFFSMQEQLSVGSEVLVANAIYGRVVRLEPDRVQVELGERLVITADRAAVFGVPGHNRQKGGGQP